MIVNIHHTSLIDTPVTPSTLMDRLVSSVNLNACLWTVDM